MRGRLELVLFVENEGASFRRAAAAFSCSASTAFEWVARWRRATLAERRVCAAWPTAIAPAPQRRRLDRRVEARNILAAGAAAGAGA